MGDGRKLRPIAVNESVAFQKGILSGGSPSGVVVKLKQRNGEKLHVLGYSEYLCIGQNVRMSIVRITRRSTYSARASAPKTVSCTPLAW